MSDIEVKLAQLLASNSVSAETKRDLRGFERDLGEDRLNSKDRDYILALHRRVLSNRRTDGTTAPPDEGMISSNWKERAAAEQARAERAEVRIKHLEDMLVKQPADSKFQEAKREFAKKYHPDQTNIDGIERIVRAEIFKEFWTILEDIERKDLKPKN